MSRSGIVFTIKSEEVDAMKKFKLTDLLIFIVTAELVGALSALFSGAAILAVSGSMGNSIRTNGNISIYDMAD